MKRKMYRRNINKTGLLAKGAVGLLIFMMSNGAHADLIVSNLTGDDDLNFGGTDIYAQSFTTDARLYRLDNIILEVLTSAVDPASGIAVDIWDDNPSESTPGAAVGSFNIPFLPPGEWGERTFSPSTEILLNPLTTYWITTTHSLASPGAFQFQGTDFAAIGPGTLGSLFSSGDGGLTWRYASDLDMKLEVNGTVVPAPTAVILGVFGLYAAATRLRRRRGGGQGSRLNC